MLQVTTIYKMIYLHKDDLITHSFERFIDESTKDFEQTLANVEAENIGIIKSYLGADYNVNEIFSVPIKNPVLTRILSKLVLYDIIRRNAARKVPMDIEQNYKEAMETLEKIAFGKLILNDLPPAVNEDGEVLRDLNYGNNSNDNFYI